MNPSVKSLVATAWVCMLVFGCGRTPSPAGPDVGGPSGIISWAPSAGTDNPLPGIDYGTVYYLGTAFVVWSDAPGGGGGSASSNDQGVKCVGSLLARAGQRVEFRCDTKDGKTGPVAINGITYELADGNLFLVCTEGEQSRVKQLKHDVSQWKFESESLKAVGPNEPEIAEFFRRPAQPQ
jgi:hypothetical protein